MTGPEPLHFDAAVFDLQGGPPRGLARELRERGIAVELGTSARLGSEPERTILFAGSPAGVEAGHRGGFGLTVGVAGTGRPHAPLLEAGAELVVDREAPPAVEVLDAWFVHRDHRRPSALGALGEGGELRRALAGRRPVLFLDYDGTLSPIVERPEDAVLPEGMGPVLERLAARYTVAVVSGRGRRDVEERVGLRGIYYAGSHGFDIAGPEGADVTYSAADEAIPAVEEVTEALRRELAGIDGAQVEPKRFTVAVHYRRVPEGEVPRVEAIVDRQVAAHPGLRKAGGKKVWEVRPDVDWDKGRAVEWLLRVLTREGAREGHLEEDAALPVYVGDDETDEDAFRALRRQDPPGIGILVAPTPRPTAADYLLQDTDEVRELLEGLAG